MKLIIGESTIHIQNRVNRRFKPIKTMGMELYPIRVKITYTKKGESNNTIIFSGHHAPLHQNRKLNSEDFLEVFFPMLLDQNKKALELIKNEIEAKGGEFIFDEVKSKLNRIYTIDNQEEEEVLRTEIKIICVDKIYIHLKDITAIQGPTRGTTNWRTFIFLSCGKVITIDHPNIYEDERRQSINHGSTSIKAHQATDTLSIAWLEFNKVNIGDILDIELK